MVLQCNTLMFGALNIRHLSHWGKYFTANKSKKNNSKSTVNAWHYYIHNSSYYDIHNTEVKDMIITISHHFPFVQLKSRAFHGHNATYQPTSVYQRQLGGAYSFLGQNTATTTSTVTPARRLPDISMSGFPKNLSCYPWFSAGTSNAMLIYSSQVIEVQ